MTDDATNSWDELYEGDVPWDIGRPQRPFVDAAERGEIDGDVLDVGCGTGTLARYLAARGYHVTGVDVSERAIDRAREASRGDERDLDVTYRVGDVLELDGDLGPFGTVVDSGAFHVFEPERRREYAEAVASVLELGGRLFVHGFGDGAPTDWGPVPFTEADVAESFDDGWRVLEVREEPFETTARAVPGTFAVLERV